MLAVPEAVRAAFDKSSTFVVEASLADRIDLGRRSIKPISESDWGIELTKRHCVKAGLKSGEEVDVVVKAAEETPPELLASLDIHDLQQPWSALSSAQRRTIAEEVFGAKAPDTRAKRVAKAVALLKSMSQGRRCDRKP